MLVQNDQDLSKLMASIFASLIQGGSVNLDFEGTTQETLTSSAKMVGFSYVLVSDSLNLTASKPVFQNGGAPAKIKRKAAPVAEEANPWAGLDQNGNVAQINEDALMKDAESVQTKKFCGDKDIMQGAKPCANCTCGLKE